MDNNVTRIPATGAGEESADFRVAVTVFATVRRADVRDQGDANNRAVFAVEQALQTATSAAAGAALAVPSAHQTLPTIQVTVHQVLELAGAGVNGSLLVLPNPRAYPRPTHD